MNKFFINTLQFIGFATIVCGCGNSNNFKTEVVDGIRWTYQVDGETVSVGTGTSNRRAVSQTVSDAVIVPSKLGGRNVTRIGDCAFAGCGALTAVAIPDGVTSIGRAAFHGCGSLANVRIPTSVTNIGDSAFYECKSLKRIKIPAGVTSVGQFAFDGTPFYENLPDGFVVFGACLVKYKGRTCPGRLTIPKGVKRVIEGAFLFCNFYYLNIPDSVTDIHCRAFNNRASLMEIDVDKGNSAYKSENGLLLTKDGKVLVCGINANGDLHIPEGVEVIGDGAFGGCKNISAVTIPDGVLSIGNDAFWGCEGLSTIAIPRSVEKIGESPFMGTGLMTISVDAANNNFKSENGMLLTKNGLTLLSGVNGDVIIPDGVKTLAGGSFSSYEKLTAVTIPPGVTNIGASAFAGCTFLESVKLPSSIVDIGKSAFRYCHKLRDLTIPLGVTEINEQAFFDCEALKFVQLPTGLEKIGDAAFGHCSSLTSILIPKTTKSIERHAFSDCSSLMAVTISSKMSSIGQCAFDDCKNLSDIYVDEGDEERVLNLLRESGYKTAGVKFKKIEDLPKDVKKLIGY